MNDSEIAALGNALWGGSALALATFAQYLLWTRAAKLAPATRTLLQWSRLPGVCVMAHRLYWNLGIWMRPEGREYAHWATDSRIVTLALVLGICAGTYMATRPLLEPHLRTKYTALVIAWLGAYSGLSVWLA